MVNFLEKCTHIANVRSDSFAIINIKNKTKWDFHSTNKNLIGKEIFMTNLNNGFLVSSTFFYNVKNFGVFDTKSWSLMSDDSDAFVFHEVDTSLSGRTRSVQVTPLEAGLIPVVIVPELRDSRNYFENRVFWNKELLFQNYFYVQDLNVIINIKNWLGDIQVSVFSSSGQADDNVTETYYGIEYSCNCKNTWKELKKELIYHPFLEKCAHIANMRSDSFAIYNAKNKTKWDFHIPTNYFIPFYTEDFMIDLYYASRSLIHVSFNFYPLNEYLIPVIPCEERELRKKIAYEEFWIHKKNREDNYFLYEKYLLRIESLYSGLIRMEIVEHESLYDSLYEEYKFFVFYNCGIQIEVKTLLSESDAKEFLRKNIRHIRKSETFLEKCAALVHLYLDAGGRVFLVNNNIYEKKEECEMLHFICDCEAVIKQKMEKIKDNIYFCLNKNKYYVINFETKDIQKMVYLSEFLEKKNKILAES
jgi:hypothetical protein